MTGLLLDELGRGLVIVFVPRCELYGVDVGVLGREVFESLCGGITGTCEDDGIGTLGDGGCETKTDATISTRD